MRARAPGRPGCRSGSPTCRCARERSSARAPPSGPLPTSAGRRSFAPSTTRLTDFRSFTFASARTVVLCCTAISVSVSPGLTTYETGAAVARVSTGARRPLPNAVSEACPAIPSTARPRVFWKRARAAFVDAPKWPSTSSSRRCPARASRNWSADTSHPYVPCTSTRLATRGLPSAPSSARVRGPSSPVTGSRVSRWNVRSPFAVIGPETPSILPKYIPFERSATWRLAISGSGAASAEGAARRPPTSSAVMRVRRRTGRTIWGPASGLLQGFTNRQYFRLVTRTRRESLDSASTGWRQPPEGDS